MANLLPSIPPPESFLYRVARRRHNPFEPPPWAYAHEDGTFGGRFDDPGGALGIGPEDRFRVIYCATQSVGAFGETIAGLRPQLRVIAGLDEINHDEPSDPTLKSDAFLDDWRSERWLGRLQLNPSLRFADLEAPDTLHILRSSPQIARTAIALGVSDIDRSALYSSNRLLTQTIARFVYEQTDGTLFGGLRYLSRLNAEWECWAIFDKRLSILSSHTEDIEADNAGLLEAATFFHLTESTF